MIVFGCAVTSRETYERCARPGFRRAAEADSLIIELDNEGTLSAGYNRLLERTPDEAEALVLAHQDLEITNPGFCEQVRRCLADPEVAIAGAAGAENVTSMDWWEPGPVIGAYEWAFGEGGGGTVDMAAWDSYEPAGGLRRVDVVDGMLLVLSPWAIEALRFDEELDPSAHGYDADICFQARERGRSVVVAPFGVTHHHELVVLRDTSDWVEAHIRFAEKWEGRAGGAGAATEDWAARARRAEAELGAARVMRNELSLLRNEAERRGVEGWRYAADLERRIAQLQASRSWRASQRLKALLGSSRERLSRP